jgi:hypothetical protein
MNFIRTNFSDYLPLWQMPVAYHQRCTFSSRRFLVKLNVVGYLAFDRKLARSLPATFVRKTISLHLQRAYRARSLYFLNVGVSFLLASSGEAAGVFFDY